jgi:hypothetical protein
MSTTAALATDEQLPQIPRLRRLPVPVAEPRAALRVVPDHTPDRPHAWQQTLTLPIPVAEEQPVIAGSAWRSDRVRNGTPTSEDGLPEPCRWAAQFVQAAVEVAGGVRSPSQLVRWTTLDVHATLARRNTLAARMARGVTTVSRRAVVRSIRVSRPREGVCEACAVVGDHGRVRAVALRMEITEGRWRVTALEIG